MRKLLLALIILLIAEPCFAVTYYAVNAGGNWQTAATWSTVAAKDASRVGNAPAAPTASIDCVLDDYSGSVTIGAAAAAKSVDCTGYAGTLTQGAYNLNVAGSLTFSAAMTYTPNATCLVILEGATGTLTTGGKLMPGIQLNGTTKTLGDNLTFINSKTASLTIFGGSTDLNGKTISGASATSRILIRSSTLGSLRQIVISGGTFANADFRDIQFSNGGADLDLSAITGGSGDCGGNVNVTGGKTVTFTTPTTQTNTGGTENWSTGTWTSRVPLPQDTVVIAGTGTLTADMPRLGKDISFSAARNLTLGNAVTSYGSLDLTGMGTFTQSGNSWIFESGNRSGTIYLTSAGKSLGGALTFAAVGTTVQVQDALVSTSGTSQISTGTLDAYTNNASVQFFAFTASNNGTAFLFPDSSITLTQSTGNAWSVNGNLSITPHNCTIYISNNGSSSKTFAGGGLIYNALSTPTGTGGVAITGANTFNNITVAAGGKLTLTANTTQTAANWVLTGTNGNKITLLSATAGTAATIAKSGGGTVQCDYLDITDTNASPASTFYYGNNSTWNSGTGWLFGRPCDHLLMGND